MNRPPAFYKLRASARFCGFALGLICVGTGIPSCRAQDARKIIEEVYDQDKSRDITWWATLDTYGKEGHSPQRKKFDFSRIGPPGHSKTLIRFTDPPEVRGVALLSINHNGESIKQWLYTPAIERVRPIAPRDRSERFVGSDFTYEDIAERVVDDFTYRILNDGETIDGHKTYKIEATPASSDRSQYKVLYLWVAQDVPCILRAEMYDPTGREVRVLHATGLKKVSGMWGARHLEITSPVENTRTVLTIDGVRVNTGLREDLFTPEALEKAPPPKGH
ncbi:MAG TPA: outer membrane lipoprotein-sorting protein [Candidatus Acidoferrales bacterium]|nr:outer membrane lipoprotein-sorting protein [Candidatus Acidoferrales bacterium]